MSTAMTVQVPATVKFHGGILRSTLRVHYARFEVAPDQLVVYQHSRWLMGMGLIGLLLARKLQGKRAIEISFGDIENIGRGKFGLNKKVLEVTMKDGTLHRFSLDDDASMKIRELVAQHGIASRSAAPARA